MKSFPVVCCVIVNALLLAAAGFLGGGPAAMALLAASFALTTIFVFWTQSAVNVACSQMQDTFAAMVETYAVLALLISFLMVNGIKL